MVLLVLRFRKLRNSWGACWLLALLACWSSSAQAQTTVTGTSETFESGNAFTVVNGTTNQWVVGTVAGNGPTTAGTKSVYISNNGGVSNAYTTGTSSVSHLYRNIALPAGSNSVSFDLKVQGETSSGTIYDYLRVYSAPTTFTPVANTLPTTSTTIVNLATYNMLGTGYVRVTAALPAATANTTARLILTWRNDGFGGTQPPASIDNFVVQNANCAAPTSLAVSTITSNSAKLTFTAASGVTNYSVTTTPATSSYTVASATTASPVNLTGLSASTTYTVNVVSNCSSSGTSTTASVTFTTSPPPPGNDDCAGAFSLTPGAAGATCAAATSGTTLNATASGTANACNGTADDDVWYSFVATATSHIVTVAGASGFDAVVNLRSGACPSTSVLCRDATSGGGTETLTATGLTVGDTYYVRVFTLTSTAPSTTANSTFTICVTTPAACAAPTVVSSNTVRSTTANITFTAGNGNTTYNVTATPTTGSPVIVNNATGTTSGTTTTVPLTGLTASTTYSVVVTGNCSGGATANSTPAYSFTTTPPPPGNDDCASAASLTPGAAGAACTTATSGTTLGATASGTANACNGTADDDVWYSFVATATSHIVTVAGASGFDAVVNLRSGACPGTSVLCQDATFGGGTETLTATGLTVGDTYYVRVFSYTGTAPSTTANSTFTTCVTTPAACAIPTTVSSNTVRSTTANITFTAGNGNTTYNVTATPTTGSPVIVSNATGTTSGTTTTVPLTGLTASTTYSVVVTGNCSGGATANSAAYSFTTPVAAPGNDDCAGAFSLTPGAAGATCAAATSGTTLNATASGTANACNGTADDDVWYSFVATATSHIVTVAGASGFDAIVNLRSGACPGTSVLCRDNTYDGGTETLTATGLTVGDTYYVRVFDWDSGVYGTFTICVTTPAACAAPTVVSSTAVTSTTANITFTAGNGNTTYNVTATPTTGSPVIVNNATGTTSGTTTTVPLTGLTASTTYSVVVTGNCSGGATANSTPAYSFTTLTPAPGNDDPTGAAAVPITADCTSPMAGSNAGATTTTVNGYANPGCGAAFTPKDVWFSFTTDATGPASTGVIVTVSGTPAGQVRVFSAASSAGPFTQVSCATGTTNNTVAPAQTVTGLTPSTTYYVFVSGYGSTDTQGAFTICVTAIPSCAAPTAVSSTAVTSTTANITFTGGNGNTTYNVTATPTTGSAVMVSNTTGTTSGTTTTVPLTGLTASTTYSVVVTGNCSGGATANSTPAYSFTTTPPPPGNDDCTSPVVLTSGVSCTTTPGTVAAATQSLAPITCGSFTSNRALDVWYSFVATGTTHTIAVTGSFDGVLEVRSNSCTTGTNVGCADATGNNETLTLSTLTAGTTYLVRYYPYLSSATTAPPTTPTFNICVTNPAPSLTVTNGQSTTASGSYSSITVQNGGTLTLTGTTTSSGAVAVQTGGILITNCQILNGAGSFTLQTGAELRICNQLGIVSTGATGAIQLTGTRTFSNAANYVYNGTAAQVTGSGLPSQVRNLTVNNSAGLMLSQAVSVSEVVRLTSGDLNTNNRALTLRSTSAGTALVDNTGGVVVGNGTMQRAITSANAIGYRHYSSPVTTMSYGSLATSGFAPEISQASTYNSSTTPGSTSPFPNIFAYDESRTLTSPATTYSDFDKGWFVPTASSMEVGRGYTVNIANTALVSFTGTFNNSNQSRTGLGRTTNADGGWHLLGNPYPAPLDWATMTRSANPADATVNLAGVDGAVYVFESAGQYGGAYRSYTNGIGSSSLIVAGQGFFVRTSTAGTTGTVRTSNTNRVTTFGTQPMFGRGTADTRPQLHLQVAGAGRQDEAFVYLETGAMVGFNGQYDAVKLPNTTGLNLSSLTGTTPLSINGLPLLTSTAVVVPLVLDVPQAGSFTFEVADLANFGTTTVYLRDALTGTQQLLSTGGRYPFTLATATAGVGRFSIVFQPATVTGTRSELSAATVSLYPNPAHHRFTLLLPPLAGQRQVKATLVNALGQVVQTRTISLTAAGATAEFTTEALATGVYMLQLQADSQTLTQRVVIE